MWAFCCNLLLAEWHQNTLHRDSTSLLIIHLPLGVNKTSPVEIHQHFIGASDLYQTVSTTLTHVVSAGVFFFVGKDNDCAIHSHRTHTRRPRSSSWHVQSTHSKGKKEEQQLLKKKFDFATLLLELPQFFNLQSQEMETTLWFNGASSELLLSTFCILSVSAGRLNEQCAMDAW